MASLPNGAGKFSLSAIGKPKNQKAAMAKRQEKGQVDVMAKVYESEADPMLQMEPMHWMTDSMGL